MPRPYNNENTIMDKSWEENIAQQLLMIRLKLQKEDGRVRDGPYNQRFIARKIGVTAVCLHNWEYGISSPGSWHLWEKWAKSLKTEFKISLCSTSNKSQETAKIIQRTFN